MPSLWSWMYLFPEKKASGYISEKEDCFLVSKIDSCLWFTHNIYIYIHCPFRALYTHKKESNFSIKKGRGCFQWNVICCGGIGYKGVWTKEKQFRKGNCHFNRSFATFSYGNEWLQNGSWSEWAKKVIHVQRLWPIWRIIHTVQGNGRAYRTAEHGVISKPGNLSGDLGSECRRVCMYAGILDIGVVTVRLPVLTKMGL